jgi:hypothetical protein
MMKAQVIARALLPGYLRNHVVQIRLAVVHGTIGLVQS